MRKTNADIIVPTSVSNWLRDAALIHQAGSQAQTARHMQTQIQIQVAQHNREITVANFRRYLSEQEFNMQKIAQFSDNYPAYSRNALLFIQNNIAQNNIENIFSLTDDLRYLNQVKMQIQQAIDACPQNPQILSENTVLRGDLDFRLKSATLESNYAEWKQLTETRDVTITEISSIKFKQTMNLLAGAMLVAGSFFSLVQTKLLWTFLVGVASASIWAVWTFGFHPFANRVTLEEKLLRETELAQFILSTFQH